MERVSLKVELRDGTGKSVARKLRREGMVPGVVYREGKSQTISLNKKEVAYFINQTAGEQGIVNLTFSNGDAKLALLKEYQTDPVMGELLHTDFFEVSLKEAIIVTVPVNAVGVAVGVKRDGGILQNVTREIEIECLPDKIPGHIDVDISELEIGGSIHVSDLIVPEGVKIVSNLEDVILLIVEPTKVEIEAPEEEEVEEAEGAEPELEKKGKKEEEESATEDSTKED